MMTTRSITFAHAMQLVLADARAGLSVDETLNSVEAAVLWRLRDALARTTSAELVGPAVAAAIARRGDIQAWQDAVNDGARQFYREGVDAAARWRAQQSRLTVEDFRSLWTWALDDAAANEANGARHDSDGDHPWAHDR